MSDLTLFPNKGLNNCGTVRGGCPRANRAPRKDDGNVVSLQWVGRRVKHVPHKRVQGDCVGASGIHSLSKIGPENGLRAVVLKCLPHLPEDA